MLLLQLWLYSAYMLSLSPSRRRSHEITEMHYWRKELPCWSRLATAVPCGETIRNQAVGSRITGVLRHYTHWTVPYLSMVESGSIQWHVKIYLVHRDTANSETPAGSLPLSKRQLQYRRTTEWVQTAISLRKNSWRINLNIKARRMLGRFEWAGFARQFARLVDTKHYFAPVIIRRRRNCLYQDWMWSVAVAASCC